MSENEFETLAMLIEHLESAKIYAGAMFEKYCNKGNYDKAIIFSGLRDRLGVEVQTVKSYIEVNKESEKRMTREDLDFIDSMNMCDEISNDAYKKIVCHCEEREPCEDCISRQEALNAITMAEVRWQAIDNINKLPSVTPTQKWIPCSEKMPKEEKKSYWICTDGGCQCECRWTNVNPFWTDLTTDWHWHYMDVPSYQKAVAWMPLPEPYKAESEDKE